MDMPFHQSLIQRLPFKRNAAALALGRFYGHPLDAEVNGFPMRLDLTETIQRQMFTGTYEPAQTTWFRSCLRVGDVFIDAGASFGYYTTLGAMLVGQTGRGFAFEPSPEASRVLEETLDRSRSKNILLTKAALGSEKGTTTLHMPTTLPALHSPSIFPSDPSFIPVTIPVIALDAFEPLRSISKIRLIKIDVEGYEPNVLRGMERTARTGQIENVICEFNSGWLGRNNTTPSALLEQFLDLGFRVYKQTPLQHNLPAHNGGVYTLQDIWFQTASSTP